MTEDALISDYPWLHDYKSFFFILPYFCVHKHIEITDIRYKYVLLVSRTSGICTGVKKSV